VSLEEQITKKDKELSEKEAKIVQLEHENKQLKKLIYGTKSERFKSEEVPAEQGNLFADPQEEQPIVEATEQITYTRKKNSTHKGRNTLPAHLPVREEIIEPEEDTSDMVKIGEQITETLEYTPASLVKLIRIRPKYVRKTESDQLDGQQVIIAPMPSRPINKCIAEPSLLSHMVVSKFIDHLPFYRQIQMFKRDFKWEPIVLFHYHRSRSVQAPKELLTNYNGWIQCDGYAVYDKLDKIIPGIQLTGCWVHARRGFDKAKDSDIQGSKYALQLFSKIYRHETECKHLSAIDRNIYRNKHTLPLVQELKDWIDQESIKVLPKSPMGKAMTYCINQWVKLMRCFDDGRLSLDNNVIENKIRPLALGRKNYLFAGSHDAAQRIAMMYSFFATCSIQEVNPRDWLTHVLENIADTKLSQLDKLLPQNFNL